MCSSLLNLQLRSKDDDSSSEQRWWSSYPSPQTRTHLLCVCMCVCVHENPVSFPVDQISWVTKTTLVYFSFLEGIEMFFLFVCVGVWWHTCVWACLCVCVCVDRNVFLLMREVFSITALVRSGNRWQQMTGDKVALSYLLLLARSPSSSLCISLMHTLLPPSR